MFSDAPLAKAKIHGKNQSSEWNLCKSLDTESHDSFGNIKITTYHSVLTVHAMTTMNTEQVKTM